VFDAATGGIFRSIWKCDGIHSGPTGLLSAVRRFDWRTLERRAGTARLGPDHGPRRQGHSHRHIHAQAPTSRGCSSSAPGRGPGKGGRAGHDWVQIVGLDGRVIATATFTPRDLPAVGAVPLLQDEARVAAGRVYYADGAGVIRTLSPAGVVAEIARLPFRGGQ